MTGEVRARRPTLIGTLQTRYAERGYSLTQVTQGANRGSFIVSKRDALADGWLRLWDIAEAEDVESAIIKYEEMRREASAQLRLRGRGAGRYLEGERVRSVKEVTVGMLLIDLNLQFDAVNLIRVTSLDTTGLDRAIFYWTFADPATGEAIGTESYSMWEHDFTGDNPSTVLFLALEPEASRGERAQTCLT